MIGPFATIIIAALYLLAFYLFAISITPENLFASIYSETFIETARQHLLLLVGFDTLIYRKYCDTPPILVGHQPYILLFVNSAIKKVISNSNAQSLMIQFRV